MIELFGLAGIPLSVTRALLLTSGAVVWTLALTRIAGLRAFAKMTSFDFAATVATASLIAQAATRSTWTEYTHAMVAIGAMFVLQWSLARLRIRSRTVRKLIRNKPRLLMANGVFCESTMREERVSRQNLMEVMRASSAENFDQVRAIVLETTGNLSVITGTELDERLLADVEGWPTA